MPRITVKTKGGVRTVNYQWCGVSSYDAKLWKHLANDKIVSYFEQGDRALVASKEVNVSTLRAIAKKLST